MSIRAYRVIKKELEEIPTFNLSQRQDIMEFFEGQEYFTDNRSDGGGGSFEVQAVSLQALLDQTDIPLDEYERKALQNDIDSAGGSEDEYIEYECF